MRQSRFITKTRKEAPAEEVSKNAQYLIRGGFIHKEMAGVYDYMPLGLRVLRKIENIIREEMNAIGGQELLMTTLQDPEIWKKSGRWDDAKVDNWFKTTLKTGTELGIANTHEETLTNILSHFASSYKDLPIYAYQFQTKFRNELRAKSGIMRTREFLMKDLYSFNKNEQEFKEFYELCAKAYLKIFGRVGLGEITYRTVAAGGSFTTNLTDEFQALSEAGEDTIYVDFERKLAVNKEILSDEIVKKLGLDKSKLVEKKAIEIGNIFPYGTVYPDIFGLKVKDENGVEQSVYMGAYGIGLGRVMGTVVETLSDDKGIIWPKSIAPFQVHLIEIAGREGGGVRTYAEKIYSHLEQSGVEVLLDDREIPAGQKFADADLLGIPYRVVVSEKTMDSRKIELKERSASESRLISEQELTDIISI